MKNPRIPGECNNVDSSNMLNCAPANFWKRLSHKLREEMQNRTTAATELIESRNSCVGRSR